jgi:thiol-disulfide isomerase/thioredoxin
MSSAAGVAISVAEGMIGPRIVFNQNRRECLLWPRRSTGRNGTWSLMNRAAWILIGLVGVAGARGDEPAPAKNAGRVVEGIVVLSGRKPIQEARVFFADADWGLSFVERATATTDARGRYKVDLAEFPWSTGKLRALVLAPGFRLADRRVEAGRRATTVDFELEPQPWKETQIRLEDGAGKPVEAVEVICSVGPVIWARTKTDAEGRCRIAMARGMPIGLTAKPAGARPIITYLGEMEDEPATVTLPVLPAIQGRVIDREGRPVPDAVVGNQIGFGPEGEGRMWPFPFSGDKAVIDREGAFMIAPSVYSRWARDLTESRPTKIRALCFAGSNFRRIAYCTIDPTQAIEPMEVTLGPTRLVRVPIVWGSVASSPQARLSSVISISPRPDITYLRLILISRILAHKEQASRAVIAEYLPEGTYQIEVNLADLELVGGLYRPVGTATRELVVPKGEGPLDLPPLELDLSDARKMVGKPAPELEATDLDTGRPVRLADFRGKVVVLDFWGYWCGVCNLNMPHLVELQRKFAGRPLAIVALHDQSVQSRAEYDGKIARVRELLWGGRDLPFRVLLDRPDPTKPDDRTPEAAGTTIKRYGGIREFPTLFVIDRDGTIVGQVSYSEHARLQSLVGELLEKAEAR